jgi:DNA-binding beta-propeller fold protein YncE
MNDSIYLTKEAGVILLPSSDLTAGIAISNVDSKVFVCCVRHVMSWKINEHQRPDGSVQLQFIRLKNIPMPPGTPNKYPFFIACSRTRHKAYVSCIGQNARKVLALDTQLNRFVDAPNSPAIGAMQMAFSPDGKKGYFPHDDKVLVTDEDADGEIYTTIPLSIPHASWAAVTKDGQYAYFGGEIGTADGSVAESVSRVNARTDQEIDLVQGLSDATLSADVSFDDTKLFVSSKRSVDVVDIKQNKQVKRLREGDLMGQIACSKVSPRACLIDSKPSTQDDWPLQIFNTLTNEVKPFETPHTSDSTAMVAFDHFGNAYVGVNEGVAVIHHARLDALFG